MKQPRNTKRFLGAVLALVLSGTSMNAVSASATPVLSGDVDQVVSLGPNDCLGCTPNELDVLERGMGMMLGEMKREAVDGDICVAEASLARDMAVLTFDAYRAGAISESRWRDGVRAKAGFAAELTDLTLFNMLLDFRSRLQERSREDFGPGTEAGLHADLYASAQFARLFEQMGRGDWQTPWLDTLRSEPQGFDPEIDEILRLQWPGRKLYDLQLANSRPYALWQESELVRLTQLPDDFLVGDIETRRDQLLMDYSQAMATEPWAVMGFGCGNSAAAGFRKFASDLARGLVIIVYYDSIGEKEKEVFQDEITVTATAPVGVWVTITIESGGGDGRGGRGGGGSGGGPAPSPEPGEPPPPPPEETSEDCTPGDPNCQSPSDYGSLLERFLDSIGDRSGEMIDNYCRLSCPGGRYDGYTTTLSPSFSCGFQFPLTGGCELGISPGVECNCKP